MHTTTTSTELITLLHLPDRERDILEYLITKALDAEYVTTASIRDHFAFTVRSCKRYLHNLTKKSLIEESENASRRSLKVTRRGWRLVDMLPPADGVAVFKNPNGPNPIFRRQQPDDTNAIVRPQPGRFVLFPHYVDADDRQDHNIRSHHFLVIDGPAPERAETDSSSSGSCIVKRNGILRIRHDLDIADDYIGHITGIIEDPFPPQ